MMFTAMNRLTTGRHPCKPYSTRWSLGNLNPESPTETRLEGLNDSSRVYMGAIRGMTTNAFDQYLKLILIYKYAGSAREYCY